jgi:hypothetical protein
VLPATIVDITLPIWRIGEAMLYASRIARAYAENPEIEIHCRFTNLKDRRLGSLDKMRHFFMGDDRVCLDEEARLNARATATEVDENLVEILQPLLRPLYERFSFFELSLDLVREEVARLRKNRL